MLPFEAFASTNSHKEHFNGVTTRVMLLPLQTMHTMPTNRPGGPKPVASFSLPASTFSIVPGVAALDLANSPACAIVKNKKMRPAITKRSLLLTCIMVLVSGIGVFVTFNRPMLNNEGNKGQLQTPNPVSADKTNTSGSPS